MCLTPDALNLMPTVRYREKEDTHTPKQTSTQELLPLANVSTIQSDGPGTAVPPRRYQPSLPTISDVLEEVGPAYR
ncbi:hypothetical protein FOFC_18191 [Fusarium oxysporum]|nr:hypothetical protein FOFC_18191 [Fusarium oxysporum]